MEQGLCTVWFSITAFKVTGCEEAGLLEWRESDKAQQVSVLILWPYSVSIFINVKLFLQLTVKMIFSGSLTILPQRCENMPCGGLGVLRVLETRLLASYFIHLHPLSTQTQPCSAIVCLKVLLVSGMKRPGLLSCTFQSLFLSRFFSSSSSSSSSPARICHHSPSALAKVSLLM